MRKRIAPLAFVLLAITAACAESPVDVSLEAAPPIPTSGLLAVDCIGSRDGSLICSRPKGSEGGASLAIFGGQNEFVKLTSTNVSYDSGTEIFQFDVTVTNLMNEAIGTPDGTVFDPEGIQVFFANGPRVSAGTGVISVANADGTGTFTATNQPYFAYNEILETGEVSAAKTWQLSIPPTVSTFSFTLLIETDVQYLLVLNEVLVNPGGTILDANGEWFEIYNAGSRSVDLQYLVIADSAASGRRPYHLISTSLVIPSGGYAVLGNTTNTTNNGGVPVNYAYGAALQLANSLDAIKIARVYGLDTLTIDRTQYSSPGTSAQNGVSRELISPASDNSSMDSSNWMDADVTEVYGPGGRGTPGAPNGPVGSGGSTSSLFRNHLEFGTPSFTGGDPGVILLSKTEYAVGYLESRGGPAWVSWNLNSTHFGDAERCDCFSADPQLPNGVARIVTSDYTGSGYSRGHMVMSEQRTTTDAENAATFLMTNVLPQLQTMNGGPWLAFEGLANDSARAGREVYNVAGGSYATTPATLNGAGKVHIPASTWKVIVIMGGGSGLAQVTTASDLRVIGVDMPQGAVGSWTTYRTTVDAIELSTGLDLLASLPDHIELVVEAGV